MPYSVLRFLPSTLKSEMMEALFQFGNRRSRTSKEGSVFMVLSLAVSVLGKNSTLASHSVGETGSD